MKRPHNISIKISDNRSKGNHSDFSNFFIVMSAKLFWQMGSWNAYLFTKNHSTYVVLSEQRQKAFSS